MLGRQVLGYAPSMVVPGICAFAAIFAYTRITSPSEFGLYALVLSGVVISNAVFFYWIQVSIPRLWVKYESQELESNLLASSLAAFWAVAGCAIVVATAVAVFAPAYYGRLAVIVVLATLLRGLLTLKQAVYRIRQQIASYNITECVQAAAGLAFGIALVLVFNMTTVGPSLGLILGLLTSLIARPRPYPIPSPKSIDRSMVKALAWFGLPLVAIFACAQVVSVSDKFFIEYFLGSDSVGAYAAGYNLVDRIVTVVFLAVATPSLPLVIRKIEAVGELAAKRQMNLNLIAILTFSVPVCMGIVLTRQEVAMVMMGSEVRDVAVQVIPWVAASAFVGGLTNHYLDHVFQLTQRTRLLLLTKVPAALCGLMLNVALIPYFGVLGAAYATLASYLIMGGVTGIVAARVFPTPVPYVEVAKIAICALVMSSATSYVQVSNPTLSLAAKVATGIVTYSLTLLLLNVAQSRDRVLKLLGRSARR